MTGTDLPDARVAVDAATQRARVSIVDADGLPPLEQISRLFDVVWGRDPNAGAVVAPELLRALIDAGAQVSAALHDGQIVAATVALLGRHPDGTLHLHSHITGVVADVQGEGVGWAMKQHQRLWALERGIGEVRWTFDPLVRRNAVFNLTKLGARAVAYREDHYGAMPDARNAGLPTDRLVASWRLRERRVVLAASGRAAEPRLDALRGGAAEVVLADDDGEPRTATAEARVLLVRVPPDIETIRARDRDRAARWAAAVRATLGEAMARGYRVTGCTRDGWYVLGAGDDVEELAR